MFFHSILFIGLSGGLFSMVIGSLWYAPRVFGNVWMRSVPITPEQIEKGSSLTPLFVSATFVAAVVLSFVMSYLVSTLHIKTMQEVLTLSALIWVGSMFPVLLSTTLWERKRISYFLINSSYWFVVTVAVSTLSFLLTL